MKESSLLQYTSSRFKEGLLFVILAIIFTTLIVNHKAAVKEDKLCSVKGNKGEASADFPGGYKLNFIKWAMQ